MGNILEQLELDEPLVIEANPFGGAEARWVASPVQTALAELIHQIDCRRRLIVVAGKAGTGKTLLTDMVVRVCSVRGLLTRRIDRGDLADVAHRATSDVMVVDEADLITDPTAQALLSTDGKTATVCVFLCLPTAVHRFSCPDTYVIDLHSLSRSDARTYLLERAKSIGHPRLFAPDALDLVIHQTGGSFRLLRSIASLAFFDAAHEGETQIAVRHVAYALESQMVENVDENDIALRSRISHGDRADEADPTQDEPVVDALETLTSRVVEGANLHAHFSYSDSADESGTNPRQRGPIGGALESPTPNDDDQHIDLESDVLRNKSALQTETYQSSQCKPDWYHPIPHFLRGENERAEHPLGPTAIRRPIGLAVKPIPDIGPGPYRLSAPMRKTSDDSVSLVESVGEHSREQRERQGKQLDDVWRAVQIRPNYLAGIEEGGFEDLSGHAFKIGYVGTDERHLQLDVENRLEQLEEEIAAHDGILNHRIEPLSDRKFPVFGIAIAGLLLAVLIYSGNDIISFATRTFEQATEDGLAQKLVNGLVPHPIQQQTHVEATEPTISLLFEVDALEPTIPRLFEAATTQPISVRPELLPPLPVIAVTQVVSLRPELLPPIPVIAVTQPVSLRPELLPPLPVIAVTQPVSLRPELLRPIPVIAVTQPVSLRPELLPPIPVISVTQPVSLRPELLPSIPVIAVTQPVSLRPELLPPIPVIAVTQPVSVRPEFLPPIPVIAVTQPVSLQPELLPPIPQIAVTRPVSLRADLAPAAIRQALMDAAVPVPTRITVTPPVSLRAELLPQRVQAQVASGRRYGLRNLDSRITLRVHRPTIVAIRDARNRIFIDRKLAPGDTYRVPNLVGLWLTAIDASAVEIILDGASAGFAGVQGAVVRDLSLSPQSIADRARDVPDP